MNTFCRNWDEKFIVQLGAQKGFMHDYGEKGAALPVCFAVCCLMYESQQSDKYNKFIIIAQSNNQLWKTHFLVMCQ